MIDTSTRIGQIPSLSDEELLRRAQAIRPVIRFNNPEEPPLYRTKFTEGDPWFIKVDGVKNIVFTHRPTAIRKAEGLKLVKTITTYHRFTDARTCMITVADVLAQVPEELLSDIVAFEPNGQVLIAELDGDDCKGWHYEIVALYGYDHSLSQAGNEGEFPHCSCHAGTPCGSPNCEIPLTYERTP